MDSVDVDRDILSIHVIPKSGLLRYEKEEGSLLYNKETILSVNYIRPLILNATTCDEDFANL